MKNSFLSEMLTIENWAKIEPYFQNLLDRNVENSDMLRQWLLDRSELEAFIEEDLAWRYIKMNCNTEDVALSESFNFFISEIEPKIAEQSNGLNKKLVELWRIFPIEDSAYKLMMRQLETEIKHFRKENLEIISSMQKEEQKYGEVSSKMFIEWGGKKFTLQQAANLLKDTNRDIRKKAFEKINNRRLLDADYLDASLSKLITLRQEIAKNVSFKNYRDFKHIDMNRFDYEIEDCLIFHESIEKVVTPIIRKIHERRKLKLRLDNLRPFDLDVDPDLKPPLKPFDHSNELLEKTTDCFSEIDEDFGNYLRIMNQKKLFDLESRMGKAPGGFNYPLHKTNLPFIFMNATGNLRDVETLVHEGGHAIHAFLAKDLELVNFKSYPSEVAELASMSMELISMEHWHHFFRDKEELVRAKISQLEGIVQVLPWVAIVDKFQHELYSKNLIDAEARNSAWVEILNRFDTGMIDWSGYEDFRKYSWQKQLHIFEVPFYYIEYAIAQLGAIALWKNYKSNPNETILNYKKALSLGYTKSIKEIYKTAGIKFDFSEEYILELLKFVGMELDALSNIPTLP